VIGYVRTLVRVATLRLTRIWQLVTFPAEPVYWRCTPTEWLPCLRKPVSSRIQASMDSRLVKAATAYCAAARRTSRSLHRESLMKCSSR